MIVWYNVENANHAAKKMIRFFLHKVELRSRIVLTSTISAGFTPNFPHEFGPGVICQTDVFVGPVLTK